MENLRRATIRIVTDEGNTVYRADPGAPVKFTHATVTLDSSYEPRLEAALPKFNGIYASGIPYGDIGIIPASHEGLELFFVAWGRFWESSTEKIWCKIWTLFDIEEMTIIEADDYDNDDTAMEQIVRQVERKEGLVARLQPQQAELFEKDEKVVNPHISTPLLFKVSTTRETFLGRSIFHIELHTEPWSTAAEETFDSPNIVRDH